MSFFFDWTALADGTYEPLQPTLMLRSDKKGLVYPGRTHWVFGGPKTGKTFLALYTAVEVLESGGHVMYIDYENIAAKIWELLTVSFGVDPQVVMARFQYRRMTEAISMDDDLLQAVNRAARWRKKKGGYEFIVVDGVNKSMQIEALEPNSNADTNKWFDLLPNRFQTVNPNAAVMCLDHSGKNGELLGSTAKAAGVTGALYKLTVHKGQMMGKGRRGVLNLELYNGGDREGEVAMIAETKWNNWTKTYAQMVGRITADATNYPGPIDYKIDSYPEDEDDASKKAALTAEGTNIPTDRLLRLSAFAQANADTPQSRNQLKRSITGASQAKDDAINYMITNGHLIEVKGKGHPLLKFVKPFEITLDNIELEL